MESEVVLYLQNATTDAILSQLDKDLVEQLFKFTVERLKSI